MVESKAGNEVNHMLKRRNPKSRSTNLTIVWVDVFPGNKKQSITKMVGGYH